MAGGDESGRDESMTDEKSSRPPPVTAPQVGIGFGQYVLVPLAADIAVRVAPDQFDAVPGVHRIPRQQSEPDAPVRQTEPHRQQHFAVVPCMTGRQVMGRMARLIPDVVRPTDERVDDLENLVELSRTKHGSMLQLVDRDQAHERTHRAVHEKQYEQERHGPYGVAHLDREKGGVREGAGHEEEPQVTDRLQPCLAIVSLHQRLQSILVDRASVPGDLEIVVETRFGHGCLSSQSSVWIVGGVSRT